MASAIGIGDANCSVLLGFDRARTHSEQPIYQAKASDPGDQRYSPDNVEDDGERVTGDLKSSENEGDPNNDSQEAVESAFVDNRFHDNSLLSSD